MTGGACPSPGIRAAPIPTSPRKRGEVITRITLCADRMEISPESPATDSGAAALAYALQILGLPADPAQIAHQSGKQKLDEGDLLRAARHFPVKARAHRSGLERLEKTPLPALAGLEDGGWLVLGRVANADSRPPAGTRPSRGLTPKDLERISPPRPRS